jgi:sarcosine oxidase subunit beta
MERTDVVIVGGGLAGLACARFLAEGGARVVLLDRGRCGDGASGALVGGMHLGLGEHPWRLVDSLGADEARGLFELGRRNIALAAELFAVRRTGGLWVAADAAEEVQVARSIAALTELGIPVEPRDPAEVATELGTTAFGSGWFSADEGAFEPDEAVAALVTGARAAGADVREGFAVGPITDDADGVVVGGLGAELVVIAAGAGCPAVDDWFGERLFPYREQVLRTAAVGQGPRIPVRSQQGWFQARQLADGGWVASGARWASPHLEEGEREPIVVDAIQAKLEALARARLPIADAAISRRWAIVDAKSCDGMPLVGPIPGAVRHVALAGFHGSQAGLGIACARAVADGILGRTAPAVPRSFLPSRLV